MIDEFRCNPVEEVKQSSGSSFQKLPSADPKSSHLGSSGKILRGNQSNSSVVIHQNDSDLANQGNNHSEYVNSGHIQVRQANDLPPNSDRRQSR